jgi:hypothetical protein
MVTNMVVVWLVVAFLTAPYQPLIGVVIALLHYMLATTTPNMLGYDLFYPPQFLQWFCHKFLNPQPKLSFDISVPFKPKV